VSSLSPHFSSPRPPAHASCGHHLPGRLLTWSFVSTLRAAPHASRLAPLTSAWSLQQACWHCALVLSACMCAVISALCFQRHSAVQAASRKRPQGHALGSDSGQAAPPLRTRGVLHQHGSLGSFPRAHGHSVLLSWVAPFLGSAFWPHFWLQKGVPQPCVTSFSLPESALLLTPGTGGTHWHGCSVFGSSTKATNSSQQLP
jgi:hypothetical protein